jgi:hypothetical protein
VVDGTLEKEVLASNRQAGPVVVAVVVSAEAVQPKVNPQPLPVAVAQTRRQPQQVVDVAAVVVMVAVVEDARRSAANA